MSPLIFRCSLIQRVLMLRGLILTILKWNGLQIKCLKTTTIAFEGSRIEMRFAASRPFAPSSFRDILW